MKKIYSCLIAIAFVLTANSQSTTLVISQVYGGGGNTSATYTHDFIEIFNKSVSSINLNGYSVQHASATGNTWTVTNLTNVVLLAGQYYLIQEAMGLTGGTTALPTPDATGTSMMGATSGKVALVNTTTALVGTCPASSSIIDIVGYGSGANCSEGAIAPAPSNTNSISRKLNGCQDTQDNSADFTVGPASPHNTSSPFNPCIITCTTATQLPSNLRYGGSSGTSMTIYFTRGNGTGSLVLCRQAGPVNATPVNGTTYDTSTVFGASTPINTDNYPVFSTTYKGVNAFTLKGLTVGAKYYFSIFEYNDPGKCYTSTGLVDSFTVGGTILRSGEMVFVGWDNDAVAGEDKLYVMNMVDITKGTKFTLVNSRFEAGAAANIRTNKWYSGGDDPYQNPYYFEFEYTGSTSIPKGSILSFESNSLANFSNITINGASTTNFTIVNTSSGGSSNFLSTVASDQVYIVQGNFVPYGTVGMDRYNLLNGVVLHGFTAGASWVPLSSAVSTGVAFNRVSRIPPDILCTAVEFTITGQSYGAYKHGAGVIGTKKELLSSIRNTANWSVAAGNANVNDVPVNEPAVNNSFTVNNSIDAGDGQWGGAVSSDWFDCGNWGDLHVPDSTTKTIVRQGAPFLPQINVAASTKAREYNNIARVGSLVIDEPGSVSLTGTGNEKLVVENDLTIGIWGSFGFENNVNALNDTLWLHGSFTNVQGFGAGMGTVVLDEGRPIYPYQLLAGPFGNLNFYNLAVKNSRSVNIASPAQVSNNLDLQNGYLNIVASPSKLTLAETATITSPVNIYGQTNKGYFNSFVNGKMFYDAPAASSIDRVFPIGKYTATDTAYAPATLTKSSTTATTYDAEYFPTAYSDLTPDAPIIHHVSNLEHWVINSSMANADAKVALSWRPRSEVGDGMPANDATALDDLVVSHYLDADGTGGSNPSLWHIEGSDLAVMPKIGSPVSIKYGIVTTNLPNAIKDPANTSASPYFTLGTKSIHNVLPLKLLDLNASLQQADIVVKWRTSNELDVDRYIVEKAIDGVHFSGIGSISSINSTVAYTYQSIDNAPTPGWNYYRLKVYDKIGKAYQTDMVKVWYGKTSDILVYPNPAYNEIKINLPTTSSISHIAIVSANGQLVKQLTSAESSLTIDIGSLSKGVYFIHILNSRQATAQKFTKL